LQTQWTRSSGCSFEAAPKQRGCCQIGLLTLPWWLRRVDEFESDYSIDSSIAKPVDTVGGAVGPRDLRVRLVITARIDATFNP